MHIAISDHFTLRKLYRFVLPSILMMVFISIYGVVDGFFVSNFCGKTAFASLNLVMPFIMILGGIGFMIGAGGTALVSKVYGEGDKEKANRYFTMMIELTVVLGILLGIVGVTCIRPVSYLLGATEDMIDYCVLYGRILTAFTPAFMLQNVFQSFLTAAEKPRIGLIVTIIAGVLNMVLDALFVGVFKWGLAGAAAASVIGQCIGGFFPFIYFLRPNTSLYRIVWTGFELRPILKVIGNGCSELLNNISSSIVSILYNLELMKLYGENGVSTYGVLMYVQFIFIAIFVGYSIGNSPIIGYNYGAKNYSELRNVFKKGFISMAIAGILLTGVAEGLAWPLAKIFVGYDQELFDLTVKAFRYFSFCFILAGMNILTSGVFTALNNGKISAIVSLVRTLVLQTSCIFLLPAILGSDGIWLANVTAEVGSYIVCMIFLIVKEKDYHYWKKYPVETVKTV